MAIKKFTPQNSDQFLGKDQGDHSIGKFGHLNYLLKLINAAALSFSPGSIIFSDGTGNPAADPTQLHWDDANNRLGIGNAAPTRTLDVSGEVKITSASSTIIGLNLSGNLTATEAFTRSNLYSGTTANTFIFSNATNGTTKLMALGSNFLSNLSHSGPLGTTVLGLNTVYPQRKAGAFINKYAFPSGTYSLIANASYPSAGIIVYPYLGSSNNTGPLNIAVNSDPVSVQTGVLVRMDTWPDADNGSTVKTFTGWHNLYSGFYDSRGAAGSTTERVNFYVAGYINASGSQIIADVMGYYVYPIKSANITNAWGVYQEGTNDKNYFAGNTLIGTSTTDLASAKLQVNSTTQGFLPPRMTGAQAEAIASPAEGLMVYSTDGSGATITSKGWWGYDGATWVKLN